MKQRTVKNEAELQRAALDLLRIERFPIVISVSEGTRTRTEGQNARYWSEVEILVTEIAQAVTNVSEQTGYTQMEVRRLIAEDMPPEYAAILFTTNKEAVHSVLKLICGIPTSTRLGTKEFSKFEERMIQVMSEISGQVKAFERRVQ